MRLLCALLLLCTATVTAAERQVVRIGTLIDGPSNLWEETRALYEVEIRALIEPEFRVVFPKEMQMVGGWTVSSLIPLFEELLEDEEVDVVITVGLLSSALAAQEPSLPKPVIASPMLETAVPQTESGIPNLSYVESPTNIERDLAMFAKLVSIEKLAILVDRELLDQLPLTEAELVALAAEQGVTAQVELVGGSASEALANLPPGTDSVYITPLLRMNDAEFTKLTEGLKRYRIPSYSLLGEDEVKKGVMAGLAPDSDWPRRARRVALNLQQILLGEPPQDLPVKMAQDVRLSLNAKTAAAVGFSPSWQILGEAMIVDEIPAQTLLSLGGALQTVLCVNPEVLAADARVKAGCGEVQVARSQLYPQIGIGGEARQIDKDRALEGFGRQPQRLVRGSLAARQVLYSDRVFARYQIERYLQCARKQDRRTVVLDVLFDVGTAYVNLLRFKSLLKIEETNLEITRRNLELAQARVEVGTSRINEVYRWESQFSSNKEAVVSARADVRVAEADLNRLLHRPSLCTISTDEKDLGDLMKTLGHQEMGRFMGTPKAFNWFSEFEILQGWKCSPEMASLSNSIQAQYRRVVSAKRAFWQPDVEVFGDTEQRIVRGGAGVTPPQIPSFESVLGSKAAVNDWMVGIRATFPLFEGGRKCGQLYKDRQLLRELCQLWQRERDQVAFRVSQAVDLILASYLSIGLAHDAAKAARKNLSFVEDAYAQGVASILDLLDAQNTQLTSERDSVNAQFNFGVDLFRLMRSVGRYDYFLSEEEKTRTIHCLEEFFAKKESYET